MKKFFAIFSVLAFLGVYAAPALTMPQEVASKIVTVDKDKKKATAKKVTAKTEKDASCCSAATAAACSETKEGASSCVDKKTGTECKSAAACKEGKAGEKK
ncbi:MAG: hypothetical protein R6V75_07325 [Bacteroidales bacterium]